MTEGVTPRLVRVLSSNSETGKESSSQNRSSEPKFYGVSEETDKLLKHWLKLQIWESYTSMLIKVFFFCMFWASFFVSMKFLSPVLQDQLGVLNGALKSLQSGPVIQPVVLPTDMPKNSESGK